MACVVGVWATHSSRVGDVRIDAGSGVSGWSVVTCAGVWLACLWHVSGRLGGVWLAPMWWPGKEVRGCWLIRYGLRVCNDLSDLPSPVPPLPAADCISYIPRFLSHQEFIIIPKYSMGI